MRRDNIERIKATVKLNSNGKTPRGRPKKRRIDKIKEAMVQLGITNWGKRTQDR